MKIAVISMHPAPYRNAFIGALVERLPGQIDVFNLFSMDQGHDFWMLGQTNYPTIELKANGNRCLRTTLVLLFRFVFSKKYDFVLWPGWTYKCLLLPIVASAVFGLKYGFAADSIEQRGISRFSLWIKRLIVNRARLVFVPGEASENFFIREFGVDKSRIVRGAYSLDGAKLEHEIISRRAGQSIIRKQLGISDNSIMFLMVANMTPNRCYPIIVDAFIKAAEKNANIVFVGVGRGVDLPLIQGLASKNKCIRVVPGCSFDEMLNLYAAADVYVHGGMEPASTALVIGAIAHLPLVSSMAVGCAADVLVNMETGLLVKDCQDRDMWAHCFEEMIIHHAEWNVWGAAAREKSRALDVPNVVESFISTFSKV